MGRARYFDNAFTVEGLPVRRVPNAQVTVFENGTTTPISETIYKFGTGGTTLSNPFDTDEWGNIVFFLDSPKRVRLRVSGTNLGTVTWDDIDVLPSAEDMLSGTGVFELGVGGGGLFDMIRRRLELDTIATKKKPVVDVTHKAYGAKCNALRSLAGASCTNGNTTVTVSDGNFTSADAGKRIAIKNGRSFADFYSRHYNGTIVSVTNSTQVIVTPAPTASVVAGAAIWGTDDSPAFKLAHDAAAALGGAVVFAPANPDSDREYLITKNLTENGFWSSDVTLQGEGIGITKFLLDANAQSGAYAPLRLGSLTGTINSSVLSFTVTADGGSNPDNFPTTGGLAVIDNEVFKIQAYNPATDTFTVLTGGRGALGTTAASHAAGTSVYLFRYANEANDVIVKTNAGTENQKFLGFTIDGNNTMQNGEGQYIHYTGPANPHNLFQLEGTNNIVEFIEFKNVAGSAVISFAGKEGRVSDCKFTRVEGIASLWIYKNFIGGFATGWVIKDNKFDDCYGSVIIGLREIAFLYNDIKNCGTRFLPDGAGPVYFEGNVTDDSYHVFCIGNYSRGTTETSNDGGSAVAFDFGQHCHHSIIAFNRARNCPQSGIGTAGYDNVFAFNQAWRNGRAKVHPGNGNTNKVRDGFSLYATSSNLCNNNMFIGNQAWENGIYGFGIHSAASFDVPGYSGTPVNNYFDGNISRNNGYIKANEDASYPAGGIGGGHYTTQRYGINLVDATERTGILLPANNFFSIGANPPSNVGLYIQNATARIGLNNDAAPGTSKHWQVISDTDGTFHVAFEASTGSKMSVSSAGIVTMISGLVIGSSLTQTHIAAPSAPGAGKSVHYFRSSDGRPAFKMGAVATEHLYSIYSESGESKVTTAGDLLYAISAGTLGRLGIGTANQVLHGGASAPSWAAIATADMAANAVTQNQKALTKPTAGAQTQVTTGVFLDITDAFVTLTLSAGTVVILFLMSYARHSAAAGRTQYFIRSGADANLFSTPFVGHPLGNLDFPFIGAWLHNSPGAGSFTYKVSVQNIDTGTTTIPQFSTSLFAMEVKK